MLTSVEAFTPQGENLMLPLQDASGGYIVKEIEGLDPVKATIVSSRFAMLDGTQYQASHREARNIVIKLGLNPDYGSTAVSELRSRLYDFFLPKAAVRLRFYLNGVAFVDIEGRVESFDAPLFAKEPEATLSILCFNPDLEALASVIASGSTVTTTATTTVAYPGTVETGFVLRLSVTHALSEFFLYNTNASGDVSMLEFAATLLTGDLVTISTVTGNKYATLLRAGVETSVMYGVAPTSNWVNLYRGDNRIRLSATGAAMPWQIEYTAKYGGL